MIGLALKLSTSCSDLYKYFLEMPCEVVVLNSNSYVVKLRCEKKKKFGGQKKILNLILIILKTLMFIYNQENIIYKKYLKKLFCSTLYNI